MRFPAQVHASINILDEFFGSLQPLDRILKNWAHKNRYAGSSDRRKIADMVYTGLRNKRSLSWIAGCLDKTAEDTGYSVMYGYCINNNLDVDEIFSGEGHAPPKNNGRYQQTSVPLDNAPSAVRYNVPDWLPPLNVKDLRILQAGQAPIDMRVNLKRTTVTKAQAALAEHNSIKAHFVPDCATALRTSSGTAIKNTKLYQSGHIEIQDASSQMAMLNMPDGNDVLDFCAGGGGKALALADQGRSVTAYDSNHDRMKDISVRARRAQSNNIQVVDLGALEGQKFSVVLVDAPCSGSGAWRRTPAEKWRLTANGLQHLCTQQVDILQQALQYVAKGGYLVYCTCSLLDQENTGTVKIFENENTTLKRLQTKQWTPAQDNCDGFFQCIWSVA